MLRTVSLTVGEALVGASVVVVGWTIVAVASFEMLGRGLFGR